MSVKQEIVSYLVLDYNKPEESRACLRSIRAFSRFRHQIIFLSNGGRQDYVLDFYREGLIDRLILNRENNGLGYGTTDLFRFCDTPHAIYFQNDQLLTAPLEQELIDGLILRLQNDPHVRAIGLAGYPCGESVYSERAHLINVAFYNSIPGKPNGGCGPHYDKPYNEGHVQGFFRDRGFTMLAGHPPFVEDKGKWSVRELPCGGISRHRTDTRQLWWDALPREPYLFPNLSPEEWRISIQGLWPPGAIPAADLPHSFTRWD